MDDKQAADMDILEAGLSAHFGRPTEIVELDRERLEDRTYPEERWRIVTAAGEHLSAIFKRLHASSEPMGNRQEILIYRRLLAGQRFGAPALYASVYDEAAERYWILLEDVGDRTLEEGQSRDWLGAVRWLAEMHGAYWRQEDHLRSLQCLAEHDPEYYQRIARAARHNLLLSGEPRVLLAFDALMPRFDRLVAYLVSQPNTLVHGDVSPQGLVIQPGSRVRPVDWELAAIGLAAWDLVRLLDERGADRPYLLETYLAEIMRQSAMPIARTAFERTLAHCEIVNALWRLVWSVEACYDVDFIENLLSVMESTWRRLE